MTNLDLAPTAEGSDLSRSVPVIDLSGPSDRVIAEIARACADWGFFQIVGHGVDPALEKATVAEMRRFFARPKTEKRALYRTRENPWGYYDRELTKNTRDKKETFDIGPEVSGAAATDDAFSGATNWPPNDADFEHTLRAWFRACEAVSGRLTDLIGQGLGEHAATLAAAFRPSHTSFIRLNHYPTSDPLEGEAETAAGLGVHHHSDSGLLTLLLQHEVSGLQVYRDGAWYGVDPIKGAFTINIGDAMQVWSNDLYPAPVHRVVAMEHAERFSIPFFHNPSYDAVIEPLQGLNGAPRYRPYGWGDFRRARADGDFADYGAEVQIADFRIG